jgi:hypothetical protein
MSTSTPRVTKQTASTNDRALSDQTVVSPNPSRESPSSPSGVVLTGKAAPNEKPAVTPKPAKSTKPKTPTKSTSKSSAKPKRKPSAESLTKSTAKSPTKRKQVARLVSEAELVNIVFAPVFESGPQSPTPRRTGVQLSKGTCPVADFAELEDFLPTIWVHSSPFDVWQPIALQPSSPSSNGKSPKQVLVRLGGRDVVNGVSLYRGSATDFAPLVRRAVFVAVVGWATKVCAMLYVNKQTGGVIEFRTWRFGIRYLAFNTSPANFTRITSSSTVALSFVMLALVLAGMLRNSRAVNVGGWMFAPVTLANSIVVDLIMQKNFAPYTDLQRMRWAFGSAALCSVLIVVWIAIEHPHERFVAFTERLKRESSALVLPNLRGVATV